MQVRDSLGRCDLLVDTMHKKIRFVWTGTTETTLVQKLQVYTLWNQLRELLYYTTLIV